MDEEIEKAKQIFVEFYFLEGVRAPRVLEKG